MDVLLAVSGGIDSMYMLHRAPELFPGASFAVAHCNFGLRGEESDADTAFVEGFCTENGICCFVRHFDTVSYAEDRGMSLEMAARELRYDWFSELSSGKAPELRGSSFGGFDLLATAHNANDNAETLILNMLRGCGSSGMRGIPRERSVGKLRIVRPLLDISRDEILSWMKSSGFGWREDRTNAETEFKRNKIRNLVFPVFRELNPSFVCTLSDDMERFRQVDDIAEDYFRAAAKSFKGPDGSISVHKLLEFKHWRYLLWKSTSFCGFNSQTFDKLVTLLGRYASEPRGTVTLGGKVFQSPTHTLEIKDKKIKIYENQDSSIDRCGSQR